MKSIIGTALAGAFALTLAGAAHAQSIPTPANPTPRFPVATDGSPLPSRAYGDEGGLLTGRSAFEPVDAVVGTGLGVANTAVGTAGAVVDGTTGATGVR